MSYLYYSNLPGVRYPEGFMQRAQNGFWPFDTYLYQAIKRLEKERLIVKFTLISQEIENYNEEKTNFDEREETVEKQINQIIEEENSEENQEDSTLSSASNVTVVGIVKKVWIEIHPASNDEENARELMDEFLKQKYVYDTEKCERTKRIKVLERKIKKNRLCLDTLPEGLYLYLTYNTYPLKCQIKAIQTLMSKPLPHHFPLIQLIDKKEYVRWYTFNLIEIQENEWIWLNSNHPGTGVQREFVRIALSTPNFALLEGPPGTGKTITICELIMQAIRRGQRILLCASTHVAVDNVLENFIEMNFTEINPVRVGDPINLSEKIMKFQYEQKRETLKKELLDFLSKNHTLMSQQYLYDVLKEDKKNVVITNIILDNANLVCGTTVGFLRHPMIWSQQRFRDKTFNGVKPLFDMLIIDEASKTTFQEFIIPALFAKKWIIVGDPKQLSPYVETKEVESNLLGMMTEPEEKLCSSLFSLAHNKRLTMLVNIGDEDLQRKYIKQAQELNIPFQLLKDGLNFNNLVTKRLLIGNSHSIGTYERLLPPDIELCVDIPTLPVFQRRREHFFKNRGSYSSGKSNWVKDTTWRLVRAYELRNKPDEQKKLLDEINNLKPHWEDVDIIHKNLDLVSQVALPSVLESLREGIKSVSRRVQTTLSEGFSQEYLANIHKFLNYQHRMHPDISKFPEKYFYGERLKDIPDAYVLRNWGYNRYSSRSVWIHVTNQREKNSRKKIKGWKATSNEKEAEIIINELREFINYAKSNRHPVNANGYWEIAILTFYLAQESLLREKLRTEFHSGAYQNFWLKNINIHISLCTVDRFQGHEADIVFLSFVRNDKIGFLNSPNRLNVAITRAKYQLVLVGDREFFIKQPNDANKSYYLTKLAEDTNYIFNYNQKTN